MRLKVPLEITAGDAPGTVRNSASGEYFELTSEAFRLLSHFRGRGASIADVVAKTSATRTDGAAIRNFIREMQQCGLLTESRTVDRAASAVKPRVANVSRSNTTFFNCPFRQVDEPWNADIAFLGIPFDLGSTGLPGSRLAPEKLRLFSSESFEFNADLFSRECRGWHSPALGQTVLEGARLADLGNLYFEVGESYEAIWTKIEAVGKCASAENALLATVGGDHSITLPLVRALGRKVTLIHIDAHSDMSPRVVGISHNHANFCRHLVEENLLNRIIQIGIREDSAESFRPSILTRYSNTALLERKIGTMAESLRPKEEFYLSLDIDAVDPAFAPGVGTPSPFGFHPSMLDALLRSLLSRGRVIGLDLVEVNPMTDRNDQTVALAVELLFRILAYGWPQMKVSREVKSAH